jgi:hypothetical protein
MKAAARSGGEPRGGRLGLDESGGRIASAAWQRPVSSRPGPAGVLTMLGCLAEIAEGVVVEGWAMTAPVARTRTGSRMLR